MSIAKKIALIAAFLGWSMLVALFSQPLRSSFATIKIDNRATKNIESIVVNFETGNLLYSAKVKISKGQNQDIIFPLYGEAGYKIFVTFADGKILTGGNGYVDSFMSDPSEVITNAKIISN